MDDLSPELIIELEKPLETKTGKIEQFRLREPTAGDVQKASKLEGMKSSIMLIALVSGVSTESLSSLPISKLKRSMAYLDGFLNWQPEVEDDEFEGEKIIDLDDAIEAAGNHADRLTLSEPTVGQIDKASKERGMAQAILLISLVSGYPRAVIEAVPIRKFKEATIYVEGFIDAVHPIGEI